MALNKYYLVCNIGKKITNNIWKARIVKTLKVNLLFLFYLRGI